ncbi:MAG: hypothetical protein RR614_15395, partial [Eubacterium sp.]
DNGMLLRSVTSVYPVSFFVAWGLNSISPIGMLSIVGFLMITAAAFLLMVFAGEKVYIKGLLAQNEGRKKSAALSTEKMGKAMGKKMPAALAIFMMDARLLLRTPIFLFNNVSIVIVIPIVMLMTFTISASSGELSWVMVNEIYLQMPDVFNLALIAFFMFFGGMTVTTATTFSREGKNIWLTQIIPVKAKDQIIGRCLTALCIQSLGIILTIATLYFFIRLSVSSILVTLIWGIMGSIPIMIFGVLVDMSRPLLNWDNPQRAVKNNMNVFICMLISIVYILVLLGASAAAGFLFVPIVGYIAFLIIAAILSVL